MQDMGCDVTHLEWWGSESGSGSRVPVPPLCRHRLGRTRWTAGGTDWSTAQCPIRCPPQTVFKKQGNRQCEAAWRFSFYLFVLCCLRLTCCAAGVLYSTMKPCSSPFSFPGGPSHIISTSVPFSTAVTLTGGFSGTETQRKTPPMNLKGISLLSHSHGFIICGVFTKNAAEGVAACVSKIWGMNATVGPAARGQWALGRPGVCCFDSLQPRGCGYLQQLERDDVRECGEFSFIRAKKKKKKKKRWAEGTTDGGEQWSLEAGPSSFLPPLPFSSSGSLEQWGEKKAAGSRNTQRSENLTC